MKKELRSCAVCRSKYSFCPNCNTEDLNKPTWYFSFCSENCKDIYNVTSEYEDGNINVKEAKARLDKLDISKINNFGDSYKKTISKIEDETKNIVKPKQAIEKKSIKNISSNSKEKEEKEVE